MSTIIMLLFIIFVILPFVALMTVFLTTIYSLLKLGFLLVLYQLGIISYKTFDKYTYCETELVVWS